MYFYLKITLRSLISFINIKFYDILKLLNFFYSKIPVSISLSFVLFKAISENKALEESYKVFFFSTDLFLGLSLVIILFYNLFMKQRYIHIFLTDILSTINIYIYLFGLLIIVNIMGASYFHYEINFDIHSNYTLFLRLFVLILYLIFFLLLKYYSIFSKNNKKFEFFFLIGRSALTLLMLLDCTNFISFLILLEIYTLISYILLVHKPSSLFSTEGGLKYFIIGSFSTGIAILGLFCLYVGIASYNYTDLTNLVISDSPFWRPKEPRHEFLDLKAGVSPLLFEYCKILNKYAQLNYWDTLEGLAIWKPKLEKMEQDIINWNLELRDIVFQKPNPQFNYYLPNNKIDRLKPNFLESSSITKQYIKETVWTKNHVVWLKKVLKYDLLKVHCDPIKNLSMERHLTYDHAHNPIYLNTLLKNFIYIVFKNWESFISYFEARSPDVSDVFIQHKTDLFHKQIDYLVNNQIEEFKISLKDCYENKLIMEWYKTWDFDSCHPWVSSWFTERAMDQEFMSNVHKFLDVANWNLHKAFVKYHYAVDQSGFIGLQKRLLSKMVDNYVDYIWNQFPEMSIYEVEDKVNQAFTNREILKYHPTYLNETRYYRDPEDPDVTLQKLYMILEARATLVNPHWTVFGKEFNNGKDLFVMDTKDIDPKLLQLYLDYLLHVSLAKDHLDILRYTLKYQMLGFTFIFISLWLKLAIAPFHMWSFDSYEGTDSWVMAFLNIIPKCVFFFFLVVMVRYFGLDYLTNIQVIAFWCIFLSSIIGSIGGLFQYSIKRMLIYSGLSNFSFLMCFFALFQKTENAQAIMNYLIIYMLITLCIFLCMFWLRNRISGFIIKNYYNLFGLILSNKQFSFVLAILFFALIGLPPLLFFFGKFYLLYDLYHYNAYVIIFILLGLTCINITYYLRIIKIVSLTMDENKCLFLYDFSRRDAFVISIVILLLCCLLYFVGPVLLFLVKILFN